MAESLGPDLDLEFQIGNSQNLTLNFAEMSLSPYIIHENLQPNCK